MRAEGYIIPERKIKGASATEWVSKVTGKRFVATPKIRHKDGKKVWTILVNGKRMYRYRYEIEALLGRPLKKNEDVHHLDGNPENDDVNNLIAIQRNKHFPFDNYRANTAEDFIRTQNLWSVFITWRRNR